MVQEDHDPYLGNNNDLIDNTNDHNLRPDAGG